MPSCVGQYIPCVGDARTTQLTKIGNLYLRHPETHFNAHTILDILPYRMWRGYILADGDYRSALFQLLCNTPGHTYRRATVSGLCWEGGLVFQTPPSALPVCWIVRTGRSTCSGDRNNTRTSELSRFTAAPTPAGWTYRLVLVPPEIKHRRKKA